MIRAWRLVKQRRAAGAFSGEGAYLHGGRWNHHGTRVVYVADSLALAALEEFVHLDRANTRLRFVSFRVEIPDELTVEVLAESKLPKDWRTEPPPESVQELGTTWARSGSAAVLKVPSVIAPVEHNFVLNTAHPDFRRLAIHDPEPFNFDPRLWK